MRVGQFVTACASAFMVCTGLHECAARSAGALPNVVDDEALWANARMKVANMGPEDLLLVGASRMQTDIDRDVLAAGFPGRRIVNLAISGRPSSWPVFADLVHRTRFSGVVVLDETEATLVAGNDQQSFVDYHSREFTLDRRINRLIETWLQERLVCVGFGQSSTRLILSLLGNRRMPARAYTITDAFRFTRSHFDWARPELLESLRRERLVSPRPSHGERPPFGSQVAAAVARWKPLVDEFRQRGGRVVFIRLPVGSQRWNLDNAEGIAAQLWHEVMGALGAPAIHAELDAELSVFDSPDASHLDARDIARFTALVVPRLRAALMVPLAVDARANAAGDGAGAR